MVTNKSSTSSGAKIQALQEAKAALTNKLFNPVDGRTEPWYRRGRDRISVVHFGIGTGKKLALAEEALNKARLDQDYARRITHAESKMSVRRFNLVVNPRIRTQFAVLPWAIPLGVYAAEVPNYLVQETYLFILTDLRLNDPQMQDRANLAKGFLNQGARLRLGERLKVFDRSVREVAYGGNPEIWTQLRFGSGDDQIVLASTKLVPVTTDTAAEIFVKSKPLSHLTLNQGKSGLEASLQPPSSLVGTKATLQIHSVSGNASRDLVLNRTNQIQLGEIGGLSAFVDLVLHQRVKNPLLGKQDFQVSVGEQLTLPAVARFVRLALGGLICGVLFALGVWAYYQAVLARHLQLWVPGYVAAFKLPPLSQSVNSRHVVRIPIEIGDLAAIVILPPLWVRYLFYSSAKLHWDSRLALTALPAGAVSARLTRMPRVCQFICRDRTYASGEFEFVFERNSRNRRNQRAQINVRFLALSSGAPTTVDHP